MKPDETTGTWRAMHGAPIASSVNDGADHEYQHGPAPSAGCGSRAAERPESGRTRPRASVYGTKAAESAHVVRARNGFEPVRPSSSTLV